MKKGQNTIEFIIVLLFFVIITIILMYSYLRLFPSEVSKSREQIACSQAETIAIQFLEFQGNQTNWDSSTNLNVLGFSNGNKLEIDYNKIQRAKTLGYYNISTDANLSIPFRISYSAYAINTTNDTTPTTLPDQYDARVFLLRQNDSLVVYAGSNSSGADLTLNLFFPFTTITAADCDSGSREIVDSNTTTTNSDGDTVKLNWLVNGGDLDCINLTTTTLPQMIFIKDMYFKNTTLGKTFPIYLTNQTILNNEFGSSGDTDKKKSFCEIERTGLVENSNEFVPVKIEVISWR
ncbi:hypothetical protein HOD83_02590 [Candidatus Woesearchaeota archaeon]|jgi:uncharacterized protein (UPF0333 family)|nr:hypothetical protein [Candidatus Woesearchaeota archaeon]MBT4114311.1 hypothetical protein [Candidatus Woesearchaeota archaeon]MBT4248455.1 hypothetical protein [Candidatus Woesearchaeota archaeon]